MMEDAPFSPFDYALSHPELEAIVLVLDQAVRSKPWRVARRRLATALRITLKKPVKGWRVRRRPHRDRIVYALYPPEAQSASNPKEPSPQAAWSLAHTLATLPDVLDAEPSFIVLQDVLETEGPDAIEDVAPPAAAFIGPSMARAAKGLAPGDHDWSVRLVRADCAWKLNPAAPQPGFASGKIKGEGIRIGHPDSGYLHHQDYYLPVTQRLSSGGDYDRVRTDLEQDYVDRKPPLTSDDGDHGLSTGSVIVSSKMSGNIVGIAPAAEIVPLRVTKRRLLVSPSPILFSGGALALSEAIRYATDDADCHVISISLGWLGTDELQAAVAHAKAKDVIVCAAAGNYTGIVVWPARYPEVIAVAGCNLYRHIWWGTAAGSEVATSGPAEQVWVPTHKGSSKPDPHRSSGTSFAVATVAGVAALWLAYHGRDYLLHHYRNQFKLTDVFRYVLSHTSDPFVKTWGRKLGAGIVNAEKVLRFPLPSITDMQTASPARMKAAALPAPVSPVAKIATTFPDIPEATLRRWLVAKVEVPLDELDGRIVGMERELIFHIVTNPALRAELADRSEPAETPRAMPMASPRASSVSISKDQLSDQLRSRLEG